MGIESSQHSQSRKERMMTPYCVSEKHISPEEIELLQKIKLIVALLPDLDLNGEKISCHLLARAIGQIFNLRWVDGYFYPSYQHSWLLTNEGNILDVYPIAIVGGPILVVGPKDCWRAPSRFHYRKKRLRIGTKRSSFQKALRQLVREIDKTKTEVVI